jgi:quercetin dioxygenase-like cupin family protein
MARVYRQGEAKVLGLPGRRALEIISGETGTRSMTLRKVEIPVANAGESTRRMHWHGDSEECIYVLSGQGTTCTDAGEYPLKAGDVIVIPPGEKHMTSNTGTEPLMLLCFFPIADIRPGMQEDPARSA